MTTRHGHAPVNGLSMHYQIDGEGDPLVFIPPHLGVAGFDPVPALARFRSVISVDPQGHGRTADLPERPMSLQQNARDVIALVEHLGIAKVDLVGHSYGGATALLVALHRPDLVRRVATYGATFGPAEDAHDVERLRFEQPPTAHSECFRFQRESYEKVAPDPAYWPRFWEKGGAIRWDGFSREELASLQVPVLVAVGDHDFVRVEHAVRAFRQIPGAELAVIPDASHFAISSEHDRVVPVIEHFLNKAAKRLPLATAALGYRSGVTR